MLEGGGTTSWCVTGFGDRGCAFLAFCGNVDES